MEKYGSVYTPDNLADFASFLILSQIKADGAACSTVLDPACGEGSLLKSYAKTIDQTKARLIGIDVDSQAIDYCQQNLSNNYKFINDNFLLPSTRLNNKTDSYWENKIGAVSLIFSNPPWSKDRHFNSKDLSDAGFSLKRNQYDAYVLFIELSYKILASDGYMCFILPDSIFDTQNDYLRKFLLENMSIKVIARLGEKLFPNVNRATTIILCKKTKDAENQVSCFRLGTNDRKLILNGSDTLENIYNKKAHKVNQSRFSKNNAFTFDIDTTISDEKLINKLRKNNFIAENAFAFSRGIEISKNGLVTKCPLCGYEQPILKHQIGSTKICSKCNKEIKVNNSRKLISSEKTSTNKSIYVGENLHRYAIDSEKYIETNVNDVDYKEKVFKNKRLLLIRKTGLGIYATVKDNCLTTQSIYVLQPKVSDEELYYYLGLFNSRLIYFYYIKEFGENEWKSHPYLTKSIIFSLPIKRFESNELSLSISTKAKTLSENYSASLDVKLENEIFNLYSINKNERVKIISELQKLPNLSAIKQMKLLEK